MESVLGYESTVSEARPYGRATLKETFQPEKPSLTVGLLTLIHIVTTQLCPISLPSTPAIIQTQSLPRLRCPRPPRWPTPERTPARVSTCSSEYWQVRRQPVRSGRRWRSAPRLRSGIAREYSDVSRPRLCATLSPSSVQ